MLRIQYTKKLAEELKIDLHKESLSSSNQLSSLQLN